MMPFILCILHDDLMPITSHAATCTKHGHAQVLRRLSALLMMSAGVQRSMLQGSIAAVVPFWPMQHLC